MAVSKTRAAKAATATSVIIAVEMAPSREVVPTISAAAIMTPATD